MRKISTTIKGKYMKEILSGEKTAEYKVDNDFWFTRLAPLKRTFDDDIVINFLCGRESYQFHVADLFLEYDEDGVWIDKVFCQLYWVIVLGERYYEEVKDEKHI